MGRHTSDLRSEQALSTTETAIAARRKYNMRQSQGVCVSCGKVEIGGARKAYCYDCSAKQKESTYRSGFRYFMRKHGINENTTSLTAEQIKKLIAEMTAGPR